MRSPFTASESSHQETGSKATVYLFNKEQSSPLLNTSADSFATELKIHTFRRFLFKMGISICLPCGAVSTAMEIGGPSTLFSPWVDTDLLSSDVSPKKCGKNMVHGFCNTLLSGAFDSARGSWQSITFGECRGPTACDSEIHIWKVDSILESWRGLMASLHRKRQCWASV